MNVTITAEAILLPEGPPSMTMIELDYRAMTKAERAAVTMALEGLGVDYRRVPASVEIRYNRIAELVLVPVFSDPLRVRSNGDMVIWGEVVPVTDANRWAVIFLLAVAARLRLGDFAPRVIEASDA